MGKFIGRPLDEVLKSKVVAIDAYVSFVGDVPVIQLASLKLENGKEVFLEGAHDQAYLPITDKNMRRDVVMEMARQCDEENSSTDAIDYLQDELVW